MLTGTIKRVDKKFPHDCDHAAVGAKGACAYPTFNLINYSEFKVMKFLCKITCNVAFVRNNKILQFRDFFYYFICHLNCLSHHIII